MMATRSSTDFMSNSYQHPRQRKTTKKSSRRTNYTAPIQISLHRSETTLSPNDELECREIYEKLKRLQPNGVCAELDTLRRALFPPLPLTKDVTEKLLTLKTYRQRAEEIPHIPAHDRPKPMKPNKTSNVNIDRIIKQVNQHAAINYSYYTRTK